jgi:ankyrin repeat protein
VELLLGVEDVSPDIPDNMGETPLFQAASQGHEGVVRQLLEQKDVNPKRPSNNGQKALMLAVENEHVGVISLLKAHKPPA